MANTSIYERSWIPAYIGSKSEWYDSDSCTTIIVTTKALNSALKRYNEAEKKQKARELNRLRKNLSKRYVFESDLEYKRKHNITSRNRLKTRLLRSKNSFV